MAEEKRTGVYGLACGHEVRASLDVEQRVRCPKCQADTIVVRVVR
jgi:predicted Zn-ribbon and HTH transcriptional regulator